MNRRIFKKITSHKYIYPTKRIQNIAYHIDENGDAIMNYKDVRVWSFILKRIKIRNKLLHKCFKTRKYLMKASSRTEWLKELHRMDYKTKRLQNQIDKGYKPAALVVKVVLNVWSKDSSDKNEYKPIKQLVFNDVEDAIESKDISSDLIDYTAYEIYINDNLVESEKYEDLKNCVAKDYIDFAKEIDKAEPVID